MINKIQTTHIQNIESIVVNFWEKKMRIFYSPLPEKEKDNINVLTISVWIPGSPKLFANQIVSSHNKSPHGYLLKASKLSTKTTHSISIKIFLSFPNKTCSRKYKSANFITFSSSDSFIFFFFFFFFYLS